MPRPPNIDHSHSFKRQQVSPEERDRLMLDAFQHLAPYYDRLLDLQSFGLHRYWRRVVVRILAPKPGQRVLDVAGGAGEMAKRLAGPGHTVVVVDPSLAMINVGRAHGIRNVSWVAGLARELPFANNSIDAAVCAFGIRNVTYVDRAMQEIYRVLKPGGRFVCLEASRPWSVIRPIYHLFCRYIIPRLGAWVVRLPNVYEYFIDSIEDVPDYREITRLFKETGFINVSCRRLTMGVVCLHVASKPDVSSEK